jgi:hypothetical protein
LFINGIGADADNKPLERVDLFKISADVSEKDCRLVAIIRNA